MLMAVYGSEDGFLVKKGLGIPSETEIQLLERIPSR